MREWLTPGIISTVVKYLCTGEPDDGVSAERIGNAADRRETSHAEGPRSIGAPGRRKYCRRCGECAYLYPILTARNVMSVETPMNRHYEAMSPMKYML